VPLAWSIVADGNLDRAGAAEPMITAQSSADILCTATERRDYNSTLTCRINCSRLALPRRSLYADT